VTEKERKALRALCEAQGLWPAPWTVDAGMDGEETNVVGKNSAYPDEQSVIAECCEAGDAAFIAASRTAVPALLDRVEALEGALRSVITDNAQDSIEDPIGHAERWEHSTGVVFKGTLDRISALLAPPAGTDKGEP
jgi:hypothetical protein